jgi:hypothetical protein
MSLADDRDTFDAEMIKRLAHDLADAVDIVHGEDPNFRWNLLNAEMRDALGADDIAVLRVRTQRPLSGEGMVKIRLGMSKSRIVQLIREKLRPTAEDARRELSIKSEGIDR